MYLLSLVNALLGWLASFDLALYRAALLGLSGEVSYPTISYPVISRMVGTSPLVELYFLQGALSNTLDFRKNLKVSALFLGVPLRPFVSNISGGGSEVVGEFDVNFRVIWILFRPVFLNLSAIVDMLMR